MPFSTSSENASSPSGLPALGGQPDISRAATDPDFFVRQAFAKDPTQGCALLFRQYYRDLCSHAVRFVYGRDVAEDIVGEVFLTFWRTRAYEHITSSYRAYLFRAVRNRAIDYLRAEFGPIESLPDSLDELTITAGYDQPDRIIFLDELVQQIGAAVQTLPPQAQRVFMMSRFEGKSQADIAAELQLTPKTVENHLTRALGRLRKALRGEWLVLVLACGPGLHLLSRYFVPTNG